MASPKNEQVLMLSFIIKERKTSTIQNVNSGINISNIDMLAKYNPKLSAFPRILLTQNKASRGHKHNEHTAHLNAYNQHQHTHTQRITPVKSKVIQEQNFA